MGHSTRSGQSRPHMFNALLLILCLACAACAERPLFGIEVGSQRIPDCEVGSVARPCK